MKTRLLLAGALYTLVITACGGGSSSPAPPVATPPTPPPVEKFGGFFFGELFIDQAMASEVCAALVTEDGQFRFLCVFTDLQFAGMSSRDGNTLTGSGLAYSTLGFLDGNTVTDLSVDATLVNGTSLTGTWSTAAGDAGSFDMSYDADYERPSSLALLAGVWQATDEFGSPDAIFTIDELGAFVASNNAGCMSIGSFLVLDSRYNLYQMSSTIMGCPIAGDYSGLALVTDDVAVNDAILFAISNDQRALFAALEKLP